MAQTYGGLVVRRHRYGKLVPDDRPHLLDAREIRELAVLFLFVIDLVAVDKDLQDASSTGSNFDRYFLTALCKELGGHPGRRTKMGSRYAVDDFNLEFAFSSHSYLLGIFGAETKPDTYSSWLYCYAPNLVFRSYHTP